MCRALDGVVSSYNASTFWGIGNTTLFYQDGLDPAKEYQIELVNTGSQSSDKLTLNTMTVFMLNDGNSTPMSTTSR